MAKFVIAYNADGSQEKRLNFMGKDFIHRMEPFENGISHALDQDLADQISYAFDCSERLIDLIFEAFDSECGEDPRDAVVKLTKTEKRFAERDSEEAAHAES